MYERTISKLLLLDYEWKNNLRYVRIFFNTPTFDRITMEDAAKFEDMLSAIGGTMGLLTGFSHQWGGDFILCCKNWMEYHSEEQKPNDEIIFS